MLDRETPPLQGIRILDLTRLLPGAYCTQMLADFGAEVIKVEQPGVGDYWRWSPPRVKTQSVQFLALNRGKCSITLDLKSEDGRNAFLKLCDTADVVVEGFRPGVMQRLGLGEATLRQRNQKLVVCALTGFGQEGPWSQVAGHDLNYLGMTGLLHLANGSEANPRATGLPIADIGAGALMAIAGILAAVVDAQRTGVGRFVDVSVTDGLLSWIGFITAQWNVPSQRDVRTPFDAPFNKPFYTVYETKDGRHLVLGAYEEKFWKTLCEVLDIPQWADRQWASGAEEDELRKVLADTFRTKTLDQWLEIFGKRDVGLTAVNTVKEALESAHFKARGISIVIDDPNEGPLEHIGNPIRFDRQAFNSLTPAPGLGADNERVLREIGYADEALKRMRQNKSI